MKILMVASEAVPFAKTGGLADVAGTLPGYLARLGHDVRLVMPRYQSIDKADLEPTGGPLGVPMGIIGELWCQVLSTTLPGTQVPVHFIDYEAFFGRDGLYNGDDAVGYMDNDNRFVFLSRAALQLCKALRWSPDVVHANDWHTAATPVLLNTLYADDVDLKDTASVLTIHNMEYQGEYYPGLMEVLDVGWEHYTHLGLEHHDQVNLLKGGIYHADRWNTVSHRYADEIKTADFGHGLEGVANDRAWALRGILNGIDYDEWNPAADRYIAAPFSADDVSGKALCKRALQEEMGLPVRDVPLIGIVSRLVHQKGIDLLADALPQILEMDVQFVLLGSGEPWAHEHFPELAELYPDRFACHMGYSNPLAHRIEAGCDLYVMPSRFEPCGLNQLYSLRYGTLPVVHAVGGLDDTVDNYVEGADRGTGFKFDELTPQAIHDTIGWAVHTWFNDRPEFDRMQQRAMRARFSWETSAVEYVLMYEEAIAARRG
jgi:starch synthase